MKGFKVLAVSILTAMQICAHAAESTPSDAAARSAPSECQQTSQPATGEARSQMKPVSSGASESSDAQAANEAVVRYARGF